MDQLSEKASDETVVCSMDFAAVLNVSETITAASVACVISSYGGTASAAGMLSGSPSLASTTVSQTVTGGIAGEVYRVKFTIATNQGRVLHSSSLLPIDDYPG